jgi:hypothetical protein
MTDLPATDEELRALVEKATPGPWKARYTCLGCGADAPGAVKACECPTRVVLNHDTGKNEWCGSGEPDWKSIAEQAQARAEAAEGENETLRLAILGGEDAPGLAASLSLAVVLGEHRKNTIHMQGRAEAAEALAQSHKDRADRLAGAATSVRQIVLYPTNDLMTDSGELNSTASLLIADTLLAALQDDGGAK